jgi:hypothetical protein
VALPILNNAILHELTVPSTGKIHNYRPYLVKEEKILLQAKESNDDKMIMRSVLELIKACVEDIDTKKLTSFDVEYVFLKLRAQSTGENTDLEYTCPHCESKNDIKVNINDAQMNMDATLINKNIQLTNDITLEMKFITYEELISLTGVTKNEVDETFKLIKSSISAVITEQERIIFADESLEDQDAFIDSLRTTQFENITEFVSDKMPYVVYDKVKKCNSCKEDYNLVLKGMYDFF